MEAESSACSDMSWSDEALKKIKCLSLENLSIFDLKKQVNEIKLALVLAVHKCESPSETMIHLQDIELAIMTLEWSSVLLCESYGSVLCSIIQASHLILPQCIELNGENPVLYSIDAFDWKPLSFAVVCNALIDCYSCFNEYIIEFLQVRPQSICNFGINVCVESNVRVYKSRLIFSER